MATAAECGQDYQDCGFVAYRKKPEGKIRPLPVDGCCGIPIESCGRKELKEGGRLEVFGKTEKGLEYKGLIFDNEIKVGTNLNL